MICSPLCFHLFALYISPMISKESSVKPLIHIFQHILLHSFCVSFNFSSICTVLELSLSLMFSCSLNSNLLVRVEDFRKLFYKTSYFQAKIGRSTPILMKFHNVVLDKESLVLTGVAWNPSPFARMVGPTSWDLFQLLLLLL